MLVRHVAALAAALAVTGCAAAPRAPSGEPAPVLLDSSGLRLPLDDYLLSPAELRKLGNARAVLARECMREAGFDFPPVGDSVDVGLRNWNERRYGITDADLAATDGYGLGERDPATRPPRPKPQLTPEQRAALEGPDGCIARVDTQQRQGSPPGVDRDLPRRLATESFARSRDTPRVRAVFDSWSACMRAAGFDYADPLAPASDDEFAGPVTPAEVTVATTDIECKRTTNLVGVWFTEERAIQRDLVAANHTALAEVRQANTAEVKAARQVLGP